MMTSDFNQLLTDLEGVQTSATLLLTYLTGHVDLPAAKKAEIGGLLDALADRQADLFAELKACMGGKP